MGGFQNSIAGGKGAITRPDLKSPNYVPGVSGWIIRRDGTAEFHTIVITAGSLLELSGISSSSTVLSAIVVGDTMARFDLNADGTLAWGSGAGATDTDLFRASAGNLKTDSNLTVGQALTVLGDLLSLGTLGAKLAVKEGTNAAMGVATLVGGTATVSTTAVNANSRIQLTTQAPGGAVGSPYVSARSVGTSFTITSTSGTDTSQVAWLIVDPA